MDNLCSEDQDAVSRLKQGDLAALDGLVKRYQVWAVHAAYAIVLDRSLAEDIAQTAFLKVAEKIHQFEEGRPFAPWFFRIIANDAIKAARKKKSLLSLEEQSEESIAQLANQLIDPSFRPEQLLEAKQTRQDILQAIQRLSPEQRAVVVMRYFLGMSEADMVTKLDRPSSTIKWWLREARNHLRTLLRSSQAEDSR
jgi:RNA polymerase sigma-70 factor, ECF subfamily